MKRLIALLVILFLPCLAWGQGMQPVGGITVVTGGGGGCTSVNHSARVNFGAGTDILVNQAYYCTKFTFPAATTVTGYMADLCKDAGSGDLTISLYTDSSNLPGSLISGSAATASSAIFDTCPTHGQKEVLLATPLASQSGTVWMCYYHETGVIELSGWYLGSSNRVTYGATTTENPTDSYSFGGVILGCAE